MQYRIKSVRVRNFKCFDNSRYYEFLLDHTKNPVILTGPNGYGKTTFFDAIELIFSNKITRFDDSIENKSTNLGKNVLLNESNIDGYIICTLINDDEECLTLIAKIDNAMKKVSYSNSIQYGLKHGDVSTESLDMYIESYSEWKKSISDFKEIKYSKDNFAVYYYVSQAESVHFLKQSISQRKDTMNVLLNLDDLDDWDSFLKNNLIGRSSSTLFNSEIKILDKKINDDISQLKKLKKEREIADKPTFFHIVDVNDSSNYPLWDRETINNENVLNNGLIDLDRMSNFVKDLKDYDSYLWNNKFEEALKKGIDDFLLCRNFIVNNKVDIDDIKKHVSSTNRILQIYNFSAFLRDKVIDPKKFDIGLIFKLQHIFPECILFDINNVEQLCIKLIDIQKSLSSKQTVISKLEGARNALQIAKNEFDINSDRCPYCGHSYGDSGKLQEAYNAAHSLLELEKGKELTEYNGLIHQLEGIIKESKIVLNKEIGYLDEMTVFEMINQVQQLLEFTSDNKRIMDVEMIVPFIDIDSSFEKMKRNEQIYLLKLSLMKGKKDYKNFGFLSNLSSYNYKELYNEYPFIIWSEQKVLLDQEKVNLKKSYIRYLLQLKNDEAIKVLNSQIRENIKKWKCLNSIREELNKIEKIYSNSIDSYKNLVLDKLRVPLLIYTGKILQDYQNGLGVFISKNEMRFVTNGDVKHDIINTFSSGQLSAFVLAFLFSMNMLYVKENDDDIGFILIDDPVQTMDDINISSMIEVLRNDFKDRQIIMSTHEPDKENYILYKFFKYKMIGQSFNVKDQLYKI